jgi:hypothetical protein
MNNQITNEMLTMTFRNVIRTTPISIRSFERITENKVSRSTGKLLWEIKMDAVDFDFDNSPIIKVIDNLAMQHAKVVLARKVRPLDEDVAREYLSNPISVNEDLLTERAPAGANAISKLVELPDDEFDNMIKRIKEMRKNKQAVSEKAE